MAGFGAPKPAPAKSGAKFQGKKTFAKHMKLFKRLQDPADRSNMVDCYVREEGSEKFWFVGKAVAKAGSCDDAALAMVAQKRLVLEHASSLVRELQLAKGGLQMWVAPPNTEMRVAQKMQGLRRVDPLRRPETLALGDCGFDPEQWTDPKLGFFTRLSDDGRPLGGPTPAKIVAAEDLQDGVESMKQDLQLDGYARVEVSVGGKAIKPGGPQGGPQGGAPKPQAAAPTPEPVPEVVAAAGLAAAASAGSPRPDVVTGGAPDGFDWGGVF